MQLARIGERAWVAIVELLIGGSERATTSLGPSWRLHVTPYLTILKPSYNREMLEKCQAD